MMEADSTDTMSLGVGIGGGTPGGRTPPASTTVLTDGPPRLIEADSTDTMGFGVGIGGGMAGARIAVVEVVVAVVSGCCATPPFPPRSIDSVVSIITAAVGRGGGSAGGPLALRTGLSASITSRCLRGPAWPSALYSSRETQAQSKPPTTMSRPSAAAESSSTRRPLTILPAPE